MPKFSHKRIILVIVAIQLIFLSWGPAHSLIAHLIGTPAEFECTISDSYEPIRGKRITIQLMASNVPLSTHQNFTIGQTVYALIATPKDAPSRITHIQTTRPWRSQNYIRTRIQTIYQRRDQDGKLSRTAVLDLPLNSIPVQLSNPIPLQRTLRELLKNQQLDQPLLQARIYRGRAMITDILIAGIPLSHLIESTKSAP
ncbi:MAG: hypothetical protein O3A01_03960 [bacterium]|nr:hypothetical protein [bacterium]